MIDHNKIYSAALATSGVMAALSSGVQLYLAGASIGGSVNTHLTDASLPWVAAISFGYAVAIAIVLCARQFQSESGQRLTRLLNWALLPALPGGTVVGICGLLKADRISGTRRHEY